MIGAISNALQGLFSASESAGKAAERIANVSSEGGDTVDLSKEAVNLKLAETSYKANIATIKTAQDMDEELLHIFDKRV